MLLDAENMFSDDQAVTATANSTNIIDLGVDRDIGPGEPVPLLCQVTENFATLTSLTVSIETDDNASFSSAKVLATSRAVPVAELLAGFKFPFEHMPIGTERYLRLVYTVGGSNATAGKITAGVTAGNQHSL